MGDALTDAVASAIGAVASTFPSLSKRMTAGSVTATVAITSRAEKVFPENLGGQVWNASGVNSDRRVVAQVAEFPALVPGMPVKIDGDVCVISSLKKTGDAAWFIGLTDPLEESLVAVRGAGLALTVSAAVVYTGFDDAGADMSAAIRRRTADIYIPRDPTFGHGAWTDTRTPEVGNEVTMKDGTRYGVRSVQEYPNSWLLKGRQL
jgi:hypothetical protein